MNNLKDQIQAKIDQLSNNLFDNAEKKNGDKWVAAYMQADGFEKGAHAIAEQLEKAILVLQSYSEIEDNPICPHGWGIEAKQALSNFQQWLDGGDDEA